MSKFIKIIEANLWERLVNVNSIIMIEELENNTTIIRVSDIDEPIVLNIDYLDFINWFLTPESILNSQTPIDILSPASDC